MVIILEQWDAIELFCRVIAKFEHPKIVLKDFRDINLITSRIEKYTQEQYYLPLSLEIFKTKYDERGHVMPRKPMSFYYFVSAIRFAHPYKWQENDFKMVVDYIGYEGKKFTDPVELEKLAPKEFAPSRRMADFVNKKWWFYFSEEYPYKEPDLQKKHMPYLCKGILSFSMFGKVALKIKNPWKNTIVNYGGNYYIARNERYLSIILKEEREHNQDIDMLFYIGDRDINMAIGKFDDFGERSLSKKAIIEPMTTKERVEIECYNRMHMSTPPDINQSFWNYFMFPKPEYDALLAHNRKEMFAYTLATLNQGGGGGGKFDSFSGVAHPSLRIGNPAYEVIAKGLENNGDRLSFDLEGGFQELIDFFID